MSATVNILKKNGALRKLRVQILFTAAGNRERFLPVLAWQVYRKKALFKRGVRCSETFRHLLAEGRILTEFLN